MTLFAGATRRHITGNYILYPDEKRGRYQPLFPDFLVVFFAGLSGPWHARSVTTLFDETDLYKPFTPVTFDQDQYP